jgi:hypothetical protein
MIFSIGYPGSGCPVLCSGVMPGEERILPVQRYRPDGSFHAIIVDLDATVSQERTEAV